MAEAAGDPDVRREFRALARRFADLAERIEAKYRARGLDVAGAAKPDPGERD